MGADADPPRGEAERLTRQDHAERIGVIGSWEWTPDTGELAWSDNLFRMYGLAPGSIVPSIPFVLDQVHPADRPKVELALESMAEDASTLDYRVVSADDVVRHFRSTVALVDSGGGRPVRLAGSVQDVSAQDSAARKLAAHAAVSKALDEWHEFEPGTIQLLNGLGSALNMPFGVLWVPRHAHLMARRIWHVQSAALAMLADATRESSPGLGSPTLGRAWQSRQPVISNQPALSGTAARKAAIAQAGVVAIVAIPAVAVDETLAVLEFLSPERIEPSGRLLRALNGIGHEVGYFLGQRRGELDVPVLTPRETEVLQLAARAVSAAGIAKELQISPATVKRHFERAYARLEVSDRAAAVAQAMRQGLIS